MSEKNVSTHSEEPQGKGGYPPRSPDEARFINKHKITTVPDANGNDDKLFKASNVKQSDRSNHGYGDEEDDKMYESTLMNSIASKICKKMNIKESEFRQSLKYLRGGN